VRSWGRCKWAGAGGGSISAVGMTILDGGIGGWGGEGRGVDARVEGERIEV